MYDASRRSGICAGKLILFWGIYGCAMASLAASVRAAGGSDLVAWGLALGAGFALAFLLGEI
ncbi:MAG TPA: hypothetical protein VGG51_05960 [Candidatus Cybelea sp.]|jgi:hypothetical protein